MDSSQYVAKIEKLEKLCLITKSAYRAAEDSNDAANAKKILERHNKLKLELKNLIASYKSTLEHAKRPVKSLFRVAHLIDCT